MIPLWPESESEILRATHILLVRIEHAEPGEWMATEPRLEARDVVLDVRIDRLWKGSFVTGERDGALVRTTIRQARIVGGRFFAVPGAWSNRSIDAGTRYLTFSSGGSESAAQSLADPDCFLVAPAEAHERSVVIVDAMGSPPVRFSILNALFEREKDRVDYLLARYVVDRLSEILFASYVDFDALMTQLEDPAFAPTARGLVLTGIYVWFLLRDPAPPNFLARLVVASARMVAMPLDESLRANILKTYLPNILGMVGAAERKLASVVFAEQPERLRATESFLADYPDRTIASPILEWARA